MVVITKCARCERKVLLAPVHPGMEPGLFEAEDHETATVPLEMRYGYNAKHKRVDDLNTLPEALHPRLCLIPHGCPIDLDTMLDDDLERRKISMAIGPMATKRLADIVRGRR